MLERRTRIEVDDAGHCTSGATYMERWRRAPPARSPRSPSPVIRYRDAAPPPALDQSRLFPRRPRQRQRPGRSRRHGPGRAAGRLEEVPGRDGRDAAEGAAARDQPSEQFYETDPRCATSPAASRGRRSGRCRSPWAEHVSRRRPLGPGAARVHARLQPLVHARGAPPSPRRWPENRVTLADEK